MNDHSSKLFLDDNPTLADFQKYVYNLEIERAFLHQNVIQKCLLMGEEVGELFKAVRKSEKLKIDDKSTINNVEEELADIFIYLCAIANRYEINLEQAFRDKEEKNKERIWQ